MKKLLIISFFVVLLFSFSMIASADSFPNSVVNLLNPVRFAGTKTVSGVTFTKNGDGYILNGTSTADITFAICNVDIKIVYPDNLFILYGGTDNSKVSVRALNAQLDFKSSNLPVILSLPFGSDSFIFYIFVQKGAVLNNVVVRPVFAHFKYTVYSYGTNISTQTNVYYNQGYSSGYSTGFDEGLSEGYERGRHDGYLNGQVEGYNSGKSDGYELGSNNGEIVGYIDGYKLGYLNYKNSTEYNSTLKNEFSAGFREGTASIEQEQHDNTLVILLPMIIIDLIIFVGLIIFKSRKRRKNK